MGTTTHLIHCILHQQGVNDRSPLRNCLPHHRGQTLQSCVAVCSDVTARSRRQHNHLPITGRVTQERWEGMGCW
jgi:hypothetical protein